MMAPIATADAIDHPRTHERHEKRRRLRELAHWYREFAERAGKSGHLGGAIADSEGIGAGGRQVGRRVGAAARAVKAAGGSITEA